MKTTFLQIVKSFYSKFISREKTTMNANITMIYAAIITDTESKTTEKQTKHNKPPPHLTIQARFILV